MTCAFAVSCHENAIPITIESDFSGYTFLGYCRISESITLPVLEKGDTIFVYESTDLNVCIYSYIADGKIISFTNNTIIDGHSSDGFSILCDCGDETDVVVCFSCIDKIKDTSDNYEKITTQEIQKGSKPEINYLYIIPVRDSESIITLSSHDIIILSRNKLELLGYNQKGEVTRRFVSNKPIITHDYSVTDYYIYCYTNQKIFALDRHYYNVSDEAFEIKSSNHIQTEDCDTIRFHGSNTSKSRDNIVLEIDNKVYYFRNGNTEPYNEKSFIDQINKSPSSSIVSFGNNLYLYGYNPKKDKILKLRDNFNYLGVIYYGWIMNSRIFFFENYDDSCNKSKLLFVSQDDLFTRDYKYMYSIPIEGRIDTLLNMISKTDNVSMIGSKGLITLSFNYLYKAILSSEFISIE